jgi:hypothetical protein
MNTTNNYYYVSDSHNVTTSTTNNYNITDSHNTTTTVVYAPVDGGGGTDPGAISLLTTIENLLNGVTGSLGDGGSPNTDNILSNLIDLLNGITSGGDGNGGDGGSSGGTSNIGDVLDGVTNTVDHLTSNLLPSVGDILGGATNGGDGNIGLPAVGDVLDGVTNTVDHLTSNLLPAVGDILGGATSGGDGNIGLPAVGDVLDGVTNTVDHLTSDVAPTTVGDIVSHLGNIDLPDLSANVSASVDAPVTDLLGDTTSGQVGGILPGTGDALIHIGDAGNLGGVADGSIGNVVANIAANLGTGDTSNLLNGTASLDLSDVGAADHSQPISDSSLASNLDLDHLASNLNLFDTGHVALDAHHA